MRAPGADTTSAVGRVWGAAARRMAMAAMVAPLLAMAAMAVGLAPGSAGAAPGVARGADSVATVAPVGGPPVPYGPLELHLAGSGCPADTKVAVVVGLQVADSDVVTTHPSRFPWVTTDATGAWTADVSFPIAYPGHWRVANPCGWRSEGYDVPDPDRDRYQIDAAPRVLLADQPATVTIVGAGCRSHRVRWYVGGMPGAEAGGLSRVDPDGTWTARFTFVAPAGWLHDPLPVWAVCEFPDGAKVGVPVHVDLSVVASAPTTTSIPTAATSGPPAATAPASMGAPSTGATAVTAVPTYAG